jgi:haloacetate dehalogenase
MIGRDPLDYLHHKLGGWGSGGQAFFDPRAMAEYERCFADPATIHASCEDYRAAAAVDLEHDAADTAPIECPLLVLWGEKGVVHRQFHPLEDWAAVATDVRGKALPSGHYLAEEVPGPTLAELQAFFA